MEPGFNGIGVSGKSDGNFFTGMSVKISQFNTAFNIVPECGQALV
jgi:hypothetical protein